MPQNLMNFGVFTKIFLGNHVNKIYKVIWNTQLGCWQAVSELAKNHTASSSSVNKISPIINITQKISGLILFGLALLPLSIHAAISNTELPTGVQINSGSASFNQNNNTLNINQNSQNLSSNWNTFNIGKDATVNFNQPNQSSTAINHVLDSNASQIMGRLNANGQVFLLNPNGVVFSKTAQVNVGGLVASTLSLNDADIQNGKYSLKGDPNSTAAIENHGAIQTLQGGTVALIAPNVKNTGSITTPDGTAHLTSASQVTLALQDGTLTQYQVDLGVLQGLVDNGGAIIANNGAVYLTAKAKDSLSKAVINHSGIIEANRSTKNAKGEIILLGDMQFGETIVSGTFKAEGENGQNGGFIETSAANVSIADTTQVSTLSDTGKTGEWLIDPTNFTIGAGTTAETTSGIGAITLQNNLASTNVTLETAVAGTEQGNIDVNAAVTWNAATALTLKAQNDININADITAANANGKLNLVYGQNTANNNANYSLNKGAKVNLQAGQNFSTQKGIDAVKNYTVITSLGVAGSSSTTDLQGINGNLSRNYVLGVDIDASATANWNSGAGFNPLGTNGSTAFTGIFDGLGHTISNLSINRPTTDFVGLLGMTSGATIQNIGLLGGSVKGQTYVGGLVGYNNNSSISNAYTTEAVTGQSHVGGLVGASSRSHINNAYATGAVTGQYYVGGLLGVNFPNSSISNAYATGAVTGQYHVGGLLGYNYNNSSISNAYATGAVSGQSNAGGLVGLNSYNSSISNAYATGAVTGQYYVGGLVGGSVDNSSISNAYATGAVTGQSYVGGLVGYNDSSSISNGYWNKETTGQVASAGGGTGLSTLQMFDKNYFTGFNFGSVWGNGDNQTTPYLLNLANNQVFNKNDLPSGAITATNRPALYTAILNINQLQNINQNLSGKYLLGNHIDATDTANWNSGAGFNPIGKGSTAFTGIFDGLSHTVNGLTINRPTTNDVGLFGMTSSATIQNIGMLGGSVKGQHYIGGLVGYNYNNSSISNAYATGAVTGQSYVGGLVGLNYSSISNAYATGAVTGQYYVGGLVGLNYSSISNAYATGAVTGQYYVGGLVGLNYNGSISNAYATGAVTGQSYYVGGLVGYSYNSSISNAYATGAVTGQDYVGGLVGVSVDNSSISNAYWNKETTGQTTSAGGGTGLSTLQMFDKNYFTSFNFGSVWGNGDNQTTPYLLNLANNQVFNKNDLPSGAITTTNRPALYTAILNINQLQNINQNLSGKYLLGNHIDATDTANWNSGAGFNPLGTNGNAFTGIFDGLGHTISNLSINRPTTNFVGLLGYTSNSIVKNIGLLGGSVKGQTYVGGLVGYNNNSSISNAYATGAVTGVGSVIGGLVGLNNTNSTISNAYATGRVEGIQSVGGLVGSNWDNSSIINAYATGAVKGRSEVGGLVGLNYDSSISNVYASGAVTGQNNVGGLLGYNTNSSISNAYATGAVIGQYSVGGLVGYNNNSSISNGYWNKQTTGQAASAGDGTGLTTAQMQNGANFAFIDADSYLGGKNTVWRIYEGQTAPLLRSFLTSLTITSDDTTTTYNGKNQGGGYQVVPVGTIHDQTLILSQQKNATPLAVTIDLNKDLYSVQQGYDLIVQAGSGKGTLKIDRAIINKVLGVIAQNRVYNGLTNADLNYSQASLDGTIYGSDQVSVAQTGIATFDNKNVGAGKTVLISGISLSGADASNYILQNTTASTTADITPASISQVSGITANNKTYDGQTNASLNTSNANFTGMVAGDRLSVVGSGSFANKNAANGKTVDITGLSLSGADAGNYVLASTTLTDTADITARTLHVTADAQNRVYDGSTAANVNFNDDRISSDILSLTGSSSFADKNAGTAKTVTSTGLSLSGADAGNYVLASTTLTDTADIAKAKINQVSGITANNRVYDASIDVVLDSSLVQFDGMVAGDELIVDTALGQFSDKNVGLAKKVGILDISLTGADAHNYELTNSTAQTTANISKADISGITGITVDNRIYNGLTNASLNTNNAQFNGIYTGDELVVVTATGHFDNAVTGQAKAVSITGLSLGGADAGNYNLVDTTALTTANISMLTPATYLQAIQFKRPRYLPETQNVLNTANLEVRQGGVNTTGIQTLAGEH